MPLYSFMNYGNAALKTLVPTLAAAWAIQAAVAVPSVVLKTDLVYDLSGSLTYLACTGVSLYLPYLRQLSLARTSGAPLPPFPALSSFSNRSLILSAFAAVWASRLGYYLFKRNIESGGDSRFEEIRQNPAKFVGAFAIQASWVCLTALPVFAVNAVPKILSPKLGGLDYIGFATFAVGFVFEAVADYQKSVFKERQKKDKDGNKWIDEGVWSTSRHPNYFGELSLWTGVTISAFRGLSAPAYPYWQLSRFALFVTPAFIGFLLLKVSGVPMLEEKADKRFGKDKKYQEYKERTPVFIPRLGNLFK